MQPEGHGGPCAMGEQGSAPSGVYDYGTLEEDGPRGDARRDVALVHNPSAATRQL